jgi:uncharacterized OB-fold protein
MQNQKSYKYEDERQSNTSISNFDDDEEKIKENNCRKCGKNWFPSHRCASKHLYHFKIINKKEVEVYVEEYMSNYDEDESPKVSLASITCIRHNCKEDDKITIQEEEVK